MPAAKVFLSETTAIVHRHVKASMRRATRVDGLAHIVPPNNDWGKPKIAA